MKKGKVWFSGLLVVLLAMGLVLAGCSAEDDGGGNNSNQQNNNGGDNNNQQGNNNGTKYTISFDANGGKSITWVQEVDAGKSFTLPYTRRDNYFLNGWYTLASSGTKAGDGGASYTPAGSMKLYAQWRTATKPSTPTGLKLTGNGNKNVTLMWNAVDGAVYYELEYAWNDGGLKSSWRPFSTVGHIASQGDEGPAPTSCTYAVNANYSYFYFHVRAQNVAGMWSDWSAECSGSVY